METYNAKINSKFLTALIFVSIVLFAVVTVFIGVSYGSKSIDMADCFHIISGKIFNLRIDERLSRDVTILWNMRMPRMLLALAVGGGLALGGCAMQSLTRNVLADPYVLGVSSGASAMVSLSFLLFGGTTAVAYITPVFAFAGALLAMFLVYGIGMVSGNSSTNNLILTGMAISVILNALSNFIITLLPNAFIMESAAMWLWGSLSSARWYNIIFPIFVSIISLIALSILGNRFDILSLGEETALTLGVSTKKIRKFTILTVSLLIGTIISASGLIGFVGFIIPHTCRIIFGSKNRKLMVFSYIIGGIFLAWMDILSRTLLAPREIAIGIFSAFCGGPFFIYLLYRKNKTGRI